MSTQSAPNSHDSRLTTHSCPSGYDIVTERRGAVGIITINRPERRNAIRLAGWQALAAAVQEFGADTATRVVIVRGAGEGAFSAGADIAEFPTLRSDPQTGAAYHEAVAETFRALGTIEQPTIAMIHGHCIGGGCELAVACDLRLADERARFAIPAARLGVVLGVEELRALRDLIGTAAAKDLLLTGRTLDATEALRVGLVSEIVAPDALAATTIALAERMAGYAPVALAAIKDLLGRLAREDDATTLDAAHAAFSQRAFASPDYNAGVRAFLDRERRPPAASE